MAYTEQEIREAYAQDEAARYADMLTRPRRALDGVALTSWHDREDPAIELTHSVMDGARHELARVKRGLDPDDVEAAVLALTGGERDPQSQAQALVTLSAWPASEIMRLTLPCRCCGVGLAADGDSMAERRALARRGHALPDGSYPIPDLKHLHSAAVLAASGHGDVAAARKLIRKRAAELGVDLPSLPGFGDAELGDEDQDQDESRPRRKSRKAPRAPRKPRSRGQLVPSLDGDAFGTTGGGMDAGGPDGGGGAAMTVTLADDPVGYYVALAAQDTPSAFDGPGTREYLGKHFGFEVHDVGSRGDGPDDEDTTKVDEVVRRSLTRGEGMFGRERQRGGWSQATVTYKPLSPAARSAAQLREHGR